MLFKEMFWQMFSFAVIDKIEKQNDIDGALSLIPHKEKLPAGIVNLPVYIENNREK